MLKPLAARTAATRGSGTDHDNVAWTPNDQGGDGTNKARSAGHCQLPSFVLSGILTVVRPTIKGCEGRSRAAFFGLAMTAEVGPSNAGTTFAALVTKADGVIVNSSGMFYTFAGGRAFGITTTARPAGDPED